MGCCGPDAAGRVDVVAVGGDEDGVADGNADGVEAWACNVANRALSSAMTSRISSPASSNLRIFPVLVEVKRFAHGVGSLSCLWMLDPVRSMLVYHDVGVV